MSNSPIACTLSPDELRCASAQLLPGLASIATSVIRSADAARLEFAPDRGIVIRISEVVERERRCCQFLDFRLEVPAAGQSVVLFISGPPGTGEFLETLAPEFR